MKSNKTLSFGITAISLIGLLSGCSTSPVKPDGSYKPESAAMTGGIMNPTVRSYPVPTMQAQPANAPVYRAPESVWNPTVIQRVAVDAYVDDQNRVVEPTYMNVVVKEGGWNLQAVRSKNGYIPASSSVKPYNMPGMEYGNNAVYENDVKVQPKDLFDPKVVNVTGYIREEDEHKVRAMAGPNEVVYRDPRVGWVIIPQSSADTVMNIEKPQIKVSKNNTNVSNTPRVNNSSNTNSSAATLDMSDITYDGDL